MTTGKLKRDPCGQSIIGDWDKHEINTKLLSNKCFVCPDGDESSFDILSDGTIAHRKSPNLVIGFPGNGGKLRLVQKGDPNRCIFEVLQRTPDQQAMVETVGSRADVASVPNQMVMGQSGSAFQLNESVTWTDEVNPLVAVAMEDWGIERGTAGTVVGFAGDKVKVRFTNCDEVLEVEMSDIKSCQPAASSELSRAQVQSPQEAPAAGASNVVPPAATTTARQIQVEVPHGTTVGSTIQVQAPDGNTLQFQIPPGVSPGGVFTVQY
jgi:hypothetical protein